MELMEIKSIKSYRKLYDPNIVQKLAIRLLEDMESQPSVLHYLTCEIGSAKKQQLTEINLARQSLVDFKKERNVLEKEIESGIIPEEVALAAPKTAPATTTSASNASKDDVNKTVDAANSNDATNTADAANSNDATNADAANSNDATNTADTANSNDNSNQMLEDALKRIEKLELEVVSGTRRQGC